MGASKSATLWVCRDCGNETLKWSGRCDQCGAWSTLKEVHIPNDRRLPGQRGTGDLPEVVNLLSDDLILDKPRLATGLAEVDRVLGGGFSPGTVGLFTGEPGIGKSTLLLSIAQTLSTTIPVLYLSGEESPEQISQRARRLAVTTSTMRLASATNLDHILTILDQEQPAFTIIDSIQTVTDDQYPSAAGSVVQVRECALVLERWAKSHHRTLLFVGHVTKDGVVAGPRTLEHLVDVVITLEGDRTSDLRILRTQKNRFGPTDEIGLLAMTSTGLATIDNPATRFLSERAPMSGSVVTVALEGQRPFLIEIQALTRPMVGAYPRRAASGFDLPRLELLLAVLEARGGIPLGTKDCFVNVSGGFRLREPAADLAVILAVASAATNQPLPKELIVFGEVGLSGEIRPVAQAIRRRDEAKRLGFSRQISGRTIRGALDEVGISRNTKKRNRQDVG